MPNYGHSKFVPVFFGKNCLKTFGTAMFGHSKFVPVFLGKIVRKNSKWPFLTIPNLCPSFWEKLWGKMQNGYFWPFQIYTKLFEKNCSKKFVTVKNGCFKFFLTIFPKKTGTNLEWPKMAILNFSWQFFPKKTCTNLE